MSGKSSDQLRGDENYEKPLSKKLEIQEKKEAVTAINKGKKIADEFDDYYEMSTVISSSEDVPTCYICLRTFPSAKSLHGHMRCHPERNYRGMVPPKNLKACSDGQEVAGCSGVAGCESSEVTWVASWPSEAKRRRTCGAGLGVVGSCSSVNGVEKKDENESVMGAAYGLMLLATGDDRYKTLPKKDEINEIRVCEKGRCDDKIEIMIYLEDVCKVPEKRKREREDAGSVLHICKECNKAFSSGQALGGHMRYHKKTASIAAADQTVVADVVAEDQGPVVWSFDLNEFPADL